MLCYYYFLNCVLVDQNKIVIDNIYLNFVRSSFEKRSFYLLFYVSKTSSKTITPFSYSFRGFIYSLISLVLILEFEYCSGGGLLILFKSQSGSCEIIFNIRNVLPEKQGPTKLFDYFCAHHLLIISLNFFIFSFLFL